MQPSSRRARWFAPWPTGVCRIADRDAADMGTAFGLECALALQGRRSSAASWRQGWLPRWISGARRPD